MRSKYGKPSREASAARRVGLPVALASLILSAAAVAAQPGEAVLAGCGLLSTGQTAAATVQFSRALAERPQCPEARVGWGAALLREGEPERALTEFQAALDLNPDWPPARLGRAAALLLLGRWQEAEAEYAALASQDVPEAEEAAAGQAWTLCAQGRFAEAQALLQARPGPEVGPALAAYVLSACEFALNPDSAQVRDGASAARGSYVGLGSCLTAPGAAWLRISPLAVLPAPPLPLVPEQHAPATLRVLSPAAGAVVGGRIALQVAGSLRQAPERVLASLGNRVVGMSETLTFPEPLDTTTWPSGEHWLSVEARDRRGEVLGRGSVRIVVPERDLTLAEPTEPPDPWVGQTLSRLLAPRLLPGVAEQLRGEVAWHQGRLVEAEARLAEAFRADPYLPRVREELLTVSRALGLPVMQTAAAVRQVPGGQRAVALTFDDGPHPKITPFILDQLDRVGARATFFLVGKQVEMYPDLTREIVARGHEVASHSYTHQDLTSLTELDVERELAASRAMIAAVTGVQVVYFRPPGGNYDARVARAASLWGFTPVFWTCNICDFYQNPRAHVVSGMMKRIEPGGIILLHNGEDLTTAILPDLLRALRGAGYRLDSIGALLATRSTDPSARNYPAE